MEKCTLKQAIPDRTGHFGEFGGRYVPETLMPALLELEEAYIKCLTLDSLDAIKIL